jgi:colanic acid/amylovoran biosynthesis protein
MTEPPRIGLIGATIYGNRGAEAMAVSTIGALRERYPGASFEFFSYTPSDDRLLLVAPDVTVHAATPQALVLLFAPFALLLALLRPIVGGRIERRAPTAVRALARCDVLIDLAGVSFIDGREKFLPFNVLTLWPALILGVTCVKFAQALGPFRSPVNRLMARWILPRCAQVFARGPRTTQHLEAFGGVSHAPAADIAFLYDPRHSLSREEPVALQRALARIGARDPEAPRAWIGVCPSSVIDAKARARGVDHVATLVQLVAALQRRGFGVVLFPNATRARTPARERNNDLPLLKRVFQRLPASDRLLLVDGDSNTAGIRRLMQALDLVVTSRFHAMVAALALAKPVLVLGWSHKYAEVMEAFGLEAQVIDWERADPEGLVGAVVDLFDERERVEQRIRAQLPAVRASAAAQVEAVAHLLGVRAPS